MLFNEKIMLDLCKELNIKVVESKNYPKLDELELSPNVINSLFLSTVDSNMDSAIENNRYFVINTDLNAA